MLFYTPGLQANSKTINRYFEAMIFKREVSKKCMIHLRCIYGKDSQTRNWKCLVQRDIEA